MLFAALVSAADAVGGTTKRTEKVAHLASCLRTMAPEEVAIGTALLSGTLRQGRIGVGWASLASSKVEAAGAPTLSLQDVDQAMDSLAAVGGAGSAALREQVLHRLLGAMTAPEQHFLRRVIGGEVRQGALAAIVTDAVAVAAGVPIAVLRRALMRAGDLPETAVVAMAGGAEALAAISLEVGRPVLPMLAAPATDAGAAIDATGQASVEWKLDGARVQVHRDGDDIRVFTRNLHDVTEGMGAVVAVARSLPVRCVVLDGEAGFGGSAVAVRLFDVLHVDGRDLLDEPLEVRRAILDEIAGPWAVPSVITSDPADAQAVLAAALEAGHEGIVVKDVRSTYEAGRRGGSWRKVKPVRTLDLVVLAAEWGYGRRRGWLSNVHLGARDDRPGGQGFVMVGKTFKGLTDKLLAWQTEAFLAIAEDRGDHVVTLKPSLVVEIALDGVQRSTRYPGGVALRFARVRRYREDKGPDDADTITVVRDLLP